MEGQRQAAADRREVGGRRCRRRRRRRRGGDDLWDGSWIRLLEAAAAAANA